MAKFDPEMDALSNRKTKGAMKIIVSLHPDGNVEANHADEEADEAMHDGDLHDHSAYDNDVSMDGGTTADHPDKAADEALIQHMIDKEHAKDQEEDAKQMASLKEEIRGHAMGGESDADVMDHFANAQPRSLGEKVKLEIAKKGKRA